MNKTDNTLPYRSIWPKSCFYYDRQLIGLIVLIVGIGMLVMSSASITISGDFGVPLYYFWKQLLSLAIGGLLLIVTLNIPIAVWERYSSVLLLSAIGLLVLVIFPGIGKEVNGSVRWIDFGYFTLQASEPAKIFLISYFASYIVRHHAALTQDFWGFIKPIMILVLIAVLLLLEPDFGTCVVLLLAALGMLFVGGVPLSRFILWITVMFGTLCALIMLSPYRMERVMSFTDPWSDPYDSGFQLTQALIAFGRGEWFGVGLGNSVQKLFYLPEAHTDFIFAILAEELGLIGSISIIFLFSWLVFRAFRIAALAAKKQHYFAAYFAYGIGFLIGLQVFINIGVSMGALPTKGLTLPLISYGGNSLIVCLILLGVLLRIQYENEYLDSTQSTSKESKW